MKATYCSKIDKLTVDGEHHGTPRIWRVVVKVETAKAKTTFNFKPKTKCHVTDLVGLIHDELRILHNVEGGIKHVYWTATAR